MQNLTPVTIGGPQFGQNFGYAPQQPITTIAPAYATNFPGLTDNQVQWIEQKTAHLQGVDKTKAQQEVYRQVLPIALNGQQSQEREMTKSQVYYKAQSEKDPTMKAKYDVTYKMADLADKLRTAAKLPQTVDDKTVIDTYTSAIPNGAQYLSNYLQNGDSAIFYEGGIGEKPNGLIKGMMAANKFMTGHTGWEGTTAKQDVQDFLAAPISAVTAIGGFGENIVGKPIERLLNKLGMKGADLTTNKELQKNILGESAESTSAKVGEFTGKMAATAALTAGAPMGALGLGGKVAVSAAQGALGSTAYAIGGEERLPTLKELALGAGIGAAIPLATYGIQKGMSALAPKLELSGVMNPQKLATLTKQLKQEGVDIATMPTNPKAVGEWMIQHGIKGSKQQIVQELREYSKQSKSLKDALLTQSSTLVESPQAVQATQKLITNALKTPGLEDDALRYIKMLYPEVNSIDDYALMVKNAADAGTDLIPKAQFTLSELENVKGGLDDAFNIYNKATGSVGATQTAKGLNNIRNSIKTLIEDTATKEGLGNIRMINNETQMARGIADAIARKSANERQAELVSFMTGKGAGGIVGGSIMSQTGGPFNNDDPLGKFGNILIGAIVGGFAGSTWAKSNVANWLGKLSGVEQSALTRFVTTKGVSGLPKELATKLNLLQEELTLTAANPSILNQMVTQTPAVSVIPGAVVASDALSNNQ